jgi:hypothetical protein
MKLWGWIVTLSAIAGISVGCKERKFGDSAETKNRGDLVQCQFYCGSTPHGSAFSAPSYYCNQDGFNSLWTEGYVTDVPRCPDFRIRVASGVSGGDSPTGSGSTAGNSGATGPNIDCEVRCGSDLIQTISVPKLYCSTRSLDSLLRDRYLTSVPRCPNLYIAPASNTSSQQPSYGGGSQLDSEIRECAVVCDGYVKQEFRAPKNLCEASKAYELVEKGYLQSVPRCPTLRIIWR